MKTNDFRLFLITVSFCLFFCNFALAQSPKPADASSSSVLIISPIFDELFAHNLPRQFKLQGEQTKGDLYMRSVILSTDQLPAWTQRVLVTGKKDLAKQEGVTAKSMANLIVSGFQQACPTTFSGGMVLDGKTQTGHDMYIMLANCGTHTLTTTKTPTSETTMVAVVRGNLNFYTIQWSERGLPIDKAPEPNVATWHARLLSIIPFLVCELKPGEAAPYPSCTSAKPL